MEIFTSFIGFLGKGWSFLTGWIKTIWSIGRTIEDVKNLNSRVGQLEVEIIALKEKPKETSWEEKSKLYKKFQTRAKSLVYVDESLTAGKLGSLEVFYCPACFSNHKISPLQPGGSPYYKICSVCKTDYQFDPEYPPQQTSYDF